MTAAAQRPKKPASPDQHVNVRPVVRLLLVLFPAVLVAWLMALCISPPAMLVVLVLLLMPLALTVRWFRLSGSLVYYELLRSARQDRNVLFRCLYACLLLGVLCWFYMSWFGAPLGTVLVEQRGIPAAQMPRFAGHFFNTFLAAQMATVLLVTPIYTAGVIAEEKERRTLEFLLATHLSSSEIVVSKLAARLATLVLLLLAGLPVLALTQLWGGVDPLLLAGGFTASGAMLLSVGSLATLYSVYARGSLEALLRTYGTLAAFLALGACVPGLNFGHPLVLFGLLGEIRSGSPDHTLVVFTGYALLHLIAAVLCLGVAIGRLRDVALAPPVPAAVPRPKGRAPAGQAPQPRPPVGDNALLWKELDAEGAFRWGQIPSTLQGVLVCFGACIVVSGASAFLTGALGEEGVPGAMNVWVRVCGTPVACLLLLPVALHAARTVSRERDRQTLDSLRSIPADDSAILWAKWLGSFTSTRYAWCLLGLIWVVGVLTGGLVPLAVPLLALAWGVYAGFAASLGLYCSTVCRTTLRATLMTAIILLAVGGGPWVLWDLGPVLLPRGIVKSYLVAFQHDGLTPPMPLWVLAFRYEEAFGYRGSRWFDRALTATAWADRVLAALAGLTCYAAAGWLLWRHALARFRAEP